MRRLIMLAATLLMPIATWAASGDNGIAGGGSATDKSGTITTGGASQVVMATNPKRANCEIQAIGADLWVAIDHAATNGSGSFYLPASAIFICPTTIPTGAIYVWGVTTNQAFTATEYSR